MLTPPKHSGSQRSLRLELGGGLIATWGCHNRFLGPAPGLRDADLVTMRAPGNLGSDVWL